MGFFGHLVLWTGVAWTMAAVLCTTFFAWVAGSFGGAEAALVTLAIGAVPTALGPLVSLLGWTILRRQRAELLARSQGGGRA